MGEHQEVAASPAMDAGTSVSVGERPAEVGACPKEADAGTATGERPAYLDRACLAMFWCPGLHISFFNEPCLALWKTIRACLMSILACIIAVVIAVVKAIRACANCVWRPLVACAKAVAKIVKAICGVMAMILVCPLRCGMVILKPICTCLAKCVLVPIKGCVSCTNFEWGCPVWPRPRDLVKRIRGAVSSLTCGVTIECGGHRCSPGLSCLIQSVKAWLPSSVTLHCAGKSWDLCRCFRKPSFSPKKVATVKPRGAQRCVSCCPASLRDGWPKCSDCPTCGACMPTCEEIGCKTASQAFCSLSNLCGLSWGDWLQACGWRPQAPGFVFAPSACEFCGCGCTLPRCCCSLGMKHLCKMPEEERLFWTTSGAEKAESSPFPWPALLVSGLQAAGKAETPEEQIAVVVDDLEMQAEAQIEVAEEAQEAKAAPEAPEPQEAGWSWWWGVGARAETQTEAPAQENMK